MGLVTLTYVGAARRPVAIEANAVTLIEVGEANGSECTQITLTTTNGIRVQELFYDVLTKVDIAREPQ